jgi:hypothetical protein
MKNIKLLWKKLRGKQMTIWEIKEYHLFWDAIIPELYFYFMMAMILLLIKLFI